MLHLCVELFLNLVHFHYNTIMLFHIRVVTTGLLVLGIYTLQITIPLVLKVEHLLISRQVMNVLVSFNQFLLFRQNPVLKALDRTHLKHVVGDLQRDHGSQQRRLTLD